MKIGTGVSPSMRRAVLVVDDNPTNLHFLQEILKNDYNVYASPSGERALRFLEKHSPDLILLDIEMPGMNGYELIKRLKGDARLADIPVIFLTALEGRDKEQEAFSLGAQDYILKPISYGVVLARVRLHMDLLMHRKNLAHLVEVKTQELLKTQNGVLDIISNMTAYRDNETGAHIMRTTYYSEAICNRLIEIQEPGYRITADFAANIAKSSKMHDIGKIGIPDGILLKPGRLTHEEFAVIKQHTVLGGKIMDESIEELGGETSLFLYTGRDIALYHHEKWDGSVYPSGLKGAEIPLSARIMAIADVYDALISKRPYKQPFTHEDSVKIIEGDSGSHFDPFLIQFCAPVFPLFSEIADRYRDEHYETKMLN